MVSGPRRGSAAGDRRIARKLRKTEAESHGGCAGPSLIELLEEALTEACLQWLTLKKIIKADVPPKNYHPTLDGPWNPDPKTITLRNDARGRIRGLAMSIAMIRHPLRRYEQSWWGYVKKIEQQHVILAKAKITD